MIHRGLVLISLSCCAFVSISFALFARDQLAGASAQQQHEIVAGQQVTPGVVPIHKARQQPRRFIDNAANELTSPFRAIVHSNSAWVDRGVPTFLALLVYGAGLGYVSRFSRGLT